MKNRSRALFWWLLAASTAGALIGGTAAARAPACVRCYPCGCATDGGYITCCTVSTCP